MVPDQMMMKNVIMDQIIVTQSQMHVGRTVIRHPVEMAFET